MRTRSGPEAGRGGGSEPRLQPPITLGIYPRSLLAPTAALIEHIGKHEHRDTDEERSSDKFENTHTHLLAAVRYGACGPPFKIEPWNNSWNNSYA